MRLSLGEGVCLEGGKEKNIRPGREITSWLFLPITHGVENRRVQIIVRFVLVPEEE